MVLKYTHGKHTQQHYIHIYIYSRICKIQHIYFSCSKYTFPWLQYVIVKANFMLYCCFGLADVTKPFESGVIFPECPLSTMDINFIYKTCINTFLLLMSFFLLFSKTVFHESSSFSLDRQKCNLGLMRTGKYNVNERQPYKNYIPYTIHISSLEKKQ